jgi:hypothetical protein
LEPLVVPSAHLRLILVHLVLLAASSVLLMLLAA